MVSDVLDVVRRLVESGRRVVLATCIRGSELGSSAVIDASGTSLAGVPAPDAVRAAVAEVMRTSVPTTVEEGDSAWFLEPAVPPPRMFVFGAISVADALVPMAAAAGYDVVVIDQRDWLARPERYPSASAVLCGVPADLVSTLDFDEATAVVSFLHEGRLEDPVLRAALASPARFVGAMGSRKTTAAKLERLREAGVPPEQVERLRAPIGLDLGSRTPQEIAVAILAQVVASRRGLA